MNKVILVGRLTRDPDLKSSAKDVDYLRFTLGVDRRFKDGVTDFPSCIAFGKTATFIGKYAHKGDMISVSGSLQTGSYDGKNGKVYTTDVNVEEAHILQHAGKEEPYTPEEDTPVQEQEPLFSEKDAHPVGLGLQIESDDLPFY